MPEPECSAGLRPSIADLNTAHLTSTSISTYNASDPFSSAGGAKYKLMSPAKLPISRSITLTVPPGLSPSSFLDSPVLLSNIKAEPSPTTGSLFKPQIVHGRVGSATLSSITGCHDTSPSAERKFSCFEFRPPSVVNSDSGLPALVSTERIQQQSERFSNLQGQRQPQPYAAVENEGNDCLHDLSLQEPVHMVAKIDNVPAEDDHNHNEADHLGQNPAVQASNCDHRASGSSLVPDKTSDDGYNWRKYGQKHVKGSEFPRSYYKCTHPNCEVKKLFERSHDGHITEIIYKGTHDHPKPQPNRRFSTGSFASVQEGFDKYSSNNRDDKYTGAYGQLCNNIDQNGTLELSSAQISQSNRTHDDGDDDDEFSKRRKMDIDVTPVVKPIREPRVVVQTLSEVDILDDGYRWRKYGQKVVRGNPNPRSYYKCTNAGCPVRKHVERASHDPKAVITTYEGKHNHDVPTAKTSSHDTAGPMAMNGVQRNKPDEIGHISLDLGVVISSTAENRSSGQQQRVLGSSTEGLQAASVSTYYGVMNPSAGQYESRQNGDGNHDFETPPLNHSSNLYPYNMGRIVMGP